MKTSIEVQAMADKWYASHPEHKGEIAPEYAAINQSDEETSTRTFSAGFSAGVSAGLTMDANDVDVSTEPYIVEAIERALEEQNVSVDIDHEALTAVIKAEEGL